MDIASISAAYEGLKIGKNILKSLYDVKVAADAKDKIDEVMSKLGEAQDTLFAMREELFRLQAESDLLKRVIAEKDKWEDTLANYILTKTVGGAIVYKSKSEPVHYLCPNCINSKQVQILQDNKNYSGKYRCVCCNAEYSIDQERERPNPNVNRRG